MARPGYKPVSLSGQADSVADAASKGWVKSIADMVNRLLVGKQNVVLEITLTDGASSSVIKDPRISAFSALYLQPLTANAAAALATAPYVIADTATQKEGEVTFDHDNNAQTDRTFNLLIIG